MEDINMNNNAFCELEETEIMTLTGGSKEGAADLLNDVEKAGKKVIHTVEHTATKVGNEVADVAVNIYDNTISKI